MARVARVAFRDASGTEQSLDADFVFSTIPLTELVGALKGEGEPSATAREAAAGLAFLRVILVFLVLRRPSVSNDHWLYFPEAAPRLNRAYESKNFDASLAPPDRTVLCLEGTSLAGDPEWERPDAELARDYARRLASTGLIREDEILESRVQRLEHGYPLYRVGYAKRLEAIWEALAGVRNLITLGRQGLFLHDNMDHAIYLGLRAARCWAQSPDPAARWRGEITESRRLKIID